ncbi:cyclic nucleotide-binding-like protein [Crucibulum laeve]|uniref:cAMP-dependent protein kinase regulatory subunit n=1 Tax=Crucibulum laeve TaxID=68775 RepID=A0A5C3M5Y6_9AGAR|nr:cyclic nucleotide-binding-like protein [Crucibulum laeve]
MSTFDSLVQDLTRDVHRVQPKDALQFCANWFQSRLEEQRARTRDVLSQRSGSISRDLPSELYVDTPLAGGRRSTSPYPQPVPIHRSSFRNSVALSPFGTLNVPGNALLSGDRTPPSLRINQHELPPTSPLTTNQNPFGSFDTTTPTPHDPGDYLHPPSSAIFARRTSVSAESIDVDSQTNEPLPVYEKTEDQLRRLKAALKAAINKNFLFRDLDEEQQTGVINAMQELQVPKNHVVIRQGDVGDYYYVVDSGLLHCYIRSEPLPPTWATEPPNSTAAAPEEKFIQPNYHPEYGKKVADCKPGSGFGELALMYGAPRAATVLAIEPSVIWSLDRVTFRTIILKARHRRRTMYEQFLSTVTLLSSLEAPERSKVADALVSTEYADGQSVVKEGEMGDTFFFIEEGEAIVTKTQKSDTGETREVPVGHLRKGDYFGELSLLHRAPRAATVSAIERSDRSMPKLKVAALDEAAFRRLLGSLREIMERKAGESYGSGPRMSR